MPKVTVNGQTEYATDGMLLSDFLMRFGETAEHPCGGKGMCKKCLVKVDGKEVLSCQYRIRSDIAVTVPEKGTVASKTGMTETESPTDNLCFVLDIGTTTLVLALLSPDEGKIIKTATRINPQRSFGADVMSRIEYCTHNGVDALNKTLTGEINSMLLSFGIKNVKKMYVSGNTVMLHTFFSEDLSGMGEAPYTPIFLEGREESAEKIGIEVVETVESLPCADTFVGADIVAGINALGLPTDGKYRILTDIGTNAETVLFCENSIVCTSAAAGPCFEGAEISCGMSASDGAIYSYSKGKIKTVGNAKAKGICGTGLIDVVAELVADGTVSETGFMECGCAEIAEGVFIDQSDIRQYQTAKSAVYSSIIALMKAKNITFDDIGELYISGGFSSEINIDNAVKTGLLPTELKGKCRTVNNSSLSGTVKYACEKNDLSHLCKTAEYLDLSSDPFFAKEFIVNMRF